MAKGEYGLIRKHTKWVGSYSELLPNNVLLVLRIGAGRYAWSEPEVIYLIMNTPTVYAYIERGLHT